MLDYREIGRMLTPEGEIIRIWLDGQVLWERELPQINYVSLGDSIAVGHSIDDNWQYDYGTDAQYGVNGNTSTVIIPNSYTDLIHKEIQSVFGKNCVTTTSFARSGDAVSHLMDKLNHDVVRNAIKKADIVTICIGANDILGHVWPELMPYIETGDLSNLERQVEASLEILATDSEPNSYTSLFNKLKEINPNAKYLFTTIYNPYKYLYLEDGHHGFFGPVLNTIPEMVYDVDEIIEDMFGIDDLGYYDITKFKWVSIELKANISSLIKDGLLNTSIVRLLFNRVNGLSTWVEKYVEGSEDFNGLNRILREKIANYNDPNFVVADTKPMFDLFPDRTDSKDDVDYSDLVNVEFTRTFDTAKMDWGQLYGGDVYGFWTNLTWKYLGFNNALPSLNVWDYISFDLEGFATDLVKQIVEKVIVPDVDPHPEHRGHKVLKRSFTNLLGYVKFDTNCGSYIRGNVLTNGSKATIEGQPLRIDHVFGEWYADEGLTQALDPDKTDFADNVSSFVLSDLVDGNTIKPKTAKTTTYYAKWYELVGYEPLG